MKTANKQSFIDSIHVGSHKKFAPNQIILIEANINYSLIHLANGKSLLTATTLKKIEKRCVSIGKFVRVNRQQLVNFDYVIEQTEEKIYLQNNFCCMISRRKKAIMKALA